MLGFYPSTGQLSPRVTAPKKKFFINNLIYWRLLWSVLSYVSNGSRCLLGLECHVKTPSKYY